MSSLRVLVASCGGFRSLTMLDSLYLYGNSALPKVFHIDIYDDKNGVQQLLRHVGEFDVSLVRESIGLIISQRRSALSPVPLRAVS